MRRNLLNLLVLIALCFLAVGPVAAKSPDKGGNGKPHGNGQMRTMTVAERKAARLNQPVQTKGVKATFAGVNPATAAFSPLTTGATTLATMSAPLATPDYFGVANWAISPLPTVASTGTTSTATAGNPLVARAYATDYATAPGTLAPVFAVIPAAVLPTGSLQSFQTWNQATPGGSPNLSAGNVFHAYVLRPTSTPSQYTVIFDSGLLTVPALPADNTTGQVETFSVGSVPVLAGDVIGFFGEGIPVDTGVTTGPDAVSYPAAAAPTVTDNILMGDPATFPLLSPQDRTYSFGATVSVGGTTTTISGGMRKFVDGLPGLCGISAPNDLGQCIPIATPDTTTFPGNLTANPPVPAADYYEIGLVQYYEQLHADLPAAGTELRGYVQLVPSTFPGAVPLDTAHGLDRNITINGVQAYSAAKPSYLGPIILAQGCDPSTTSCNAASIRPVRVKFTNLLPTGPAGDLFIPTDTTYMGAGTGPTGADYTQSRATLHLHGGNTPWISDGTPHQWTVPVGEVTAYSKGVSAAYVPDMWFDASGNLIASCAGSTTCAVAGANNDPGIGSLTFYWTNQQGGRLMFYHDHAYGITRLNVYAGEAAGYLLTDPNEEAALAAASVPGTTSDLAHLVPLVIQDKTFVPDSGTVGGQLAATDPTWDVTKYGGLGNLWFPHVYTPNQNPADVTGANAFGRWDYGPWFFPPQDPATLVSQPFTCTSSAYSASNPPAFPPLLCPGTPNPSGVPEGFMDTPVVNGTAYPTMTVDPAAYRFQILSAGNDRTWNLGLYQADPLTVAVTNGGSGYTSAPAVSFSGGAGGGTGVAATSVISTGSVTQILVTGVGSGYTSTTPNVNISGDGTGATAMAVIDPLAGQVTAVNVINGGTGYTFANVAIDPPAGCATGCVTAAATASVTPAGEVLSITVTNPGNAPWTAAPTVTIAPPASGTQASAFASVNTEVKMVDAVPHTAASTIKPCTTSIPTGGAQLTAALLDGTGNPLNGTGLPANCYPSSWPTDGRDGGVPDPATAGPPIIEIASEGGVLPSPAVIPSTPIGYEYNRRSITVLNVFDHGLLLGPAERADVVVDFSKFAGKTLILYNDAAAPVPAFDSRNDYYTGNPDQTTTGGAPSTLPGYGPNTRTVLQIKVNATGTPNVTPFSLPAVTAALPGIFASTQPKIIVPEPAFPAANGGAASPTYSRIQDNSLGGWLGTGVAVGNLTLTDAGSGYTAAPTVTIAAPTTAGGTTATASAALQPTTVASLSLGAGGSGYTAAPTVTISGGGGTGATGTATLAPTTISSVNLTAGGSGYRAAPTVTIAAPACVPAPVTCVQATGTATVRSNGQRNVTGVVITNPGAGYTSVPSVTFAPVNGGTGAAATAVLAPAAVATVTLGVGGSGYTSVPNVALSGGGGSGATASAALTPTSIKSLTLTSGGSGYTAAPLVTIDAPATGTTATATASPASTPLQPKTIQELFTLDYGRMNATLGVELPFTNFLTQTTIPYGYVDPPTEILKDGETQLWKITHNGVDTHFIHFHLFNVQVINRVGWDGAIKPPDPNEVGWKDTVRMNPLEDVIVALHPMQQNLPWPIPNSIRPLDVTKPVGSALPNEFTNVDPTNQPATVTNDMTNFGDEYVWHCHILGHEENDMMRAMVLAVPPNGLASSLAAGPPVGNGNKPRSVTLTWVDKSTNETAFIVQQATSASGPWTTLATVATPGTFGPGYGSSVNGTVTYTATGLSRGTTYYFQVIAVNTVGYTKTYAAPAVGYPHLSVNAAPSSTVAVPVP
jgi:FtsP/CotA-like multicopper oxidase with cupredoxin domain